MKVYEDIAKRTGGNIYIGVTGPVRTGKSTFVKRMMQTLVIPNIENEYVRERAKDELPQSGSGKTIMTAEPKFVPEQAVEISPDGTAALRVRLIDSVGYMIPGAAGAEEDGKPRLVTTPWYDHEIPMTEAAELGTKKVMEDHCTVGLVVTTDGTITDLPREAYPAAEERAIRDMQQTGKPFVVLVNSVAPEEIAAKELARALTERFGVKALTVNCLTMTETELGSILRELLGEFAMSSLQFYFPGWLQALEQSHPIKEELYQAILKAAGKIKKLSQVTEVLPELEDLEQVAACSVLSADLGTGAVSCRLDPPEGLFYQILSQRSGLDLHSDADLLQALSDLKTVRTDYERIASALEQARSTGYGVVMPAMEELRLQTPELVKKGGAYGVRLRASAPSIHLLRANVTTELSPMVGSEQQSQELVNHLLEAYEGDTQVLFDNNIFGKSLYEMISDGLASKLDRLPDTARLKLKDALTRIVNDGANGLICLIL